MGEPRPGRACQPDPPPVHTALVIHAAAVLESERVERR